jgi:methyl-accepting chemotaxis protein
VNSWVIANTKKEERAFAILDGIRRERILFEEFDPRSPEVNDHIAQFRETNDNVVADLVKLWQEEIDVGIWRTSSLELKGKLRLLKELVGQITATSFPLVSDEEAALLGISASKDTRLGTDADDATKALAASCEEDFSRYEKGGGIPLWLRADVSDVGERVTPVLTLAKVVSCQQGLRVNAEDIFLWQLAYTNDIEPALVSIQTDVDNFSDEISNSVKNFATRLQSFIFYIFLSVIILVILLGLSISNAIVGPILRVRDAAMEIARGDLNKRVK